MKTREADNSLIQSRPIKAIGLTFAIVVGVVVGLFCALSLIFTVMNIMT